MFGGDCFARAELGRGLSERFRSKMASRSRYHSDLTGGLYSAYFANRASEGPRDRLQTIGLMLSDFLESEE